MPSKMLKLKVVHYVFLFSPKCSKSAICTDHPSIRAISNVRFSSEFNYSPVSTSYICNILDHLNPRKAVGVDGISPRILRLGSPVLAEKVTNLINFCILNRSLPSEWKQARLTPVFKRGVDTDKANYRPVSILTSLSKVFEKVIYDQTWNAFHNVLSSNLSGFMKTHSCCTALLKMTEDWRSSIDNKEAVAAVAVDLSKAFDAIDHSLLLAKLKAHGFSTRALELMSTFLLGRQQCVRLDGVCSDFKTVKSGVPQGSLLGPLLFNIFINDLNFCVPNVSLRLYADDTTAYLSDVSPTILEFSFNKDLQALSSWFESNYLTVNSAKTQALSVGPCAYQYSLFLNNAQIEFLRSIKILGVTLDKDLSYKEHISDQLKKAYAKASALRRIRRFLPHDAMMKLYKAFILPHLEYCGPLFVGIGTGQRNRLEDGNCYILRTLIGHNKLMSYDELLTAASMTSLYCRRLHQALILLFKCLNGTGPTYIASLFKYKHTPYRLRGEGLNLELPKFNCKFKKNSITYSLTKLWNSLPSHVRLSSDSSDFRSKLQDCSFLERVL